MDIKAELEKEVMERKAKVAETSTCLKSCLVSILRQRFAMFDCYFN